MLRGRGHLRVSGSGTKTPEVSGYPVSDKVLIISDKVLVIRNTVSVVRNTVLVGSDPVIAPGVALRIHPRVSCIGAHVSVRVDRRRLGEEPACRQGEPDLRRESAEGPDAAAREPMRTPPRRPTIRDARAPAFALPTCHRARPLDHARDARRPTPARGARPPGSDASAHRDEIGARKTSQGACRRRRAEASTGRAVGRSISIAGIVTLTPTIWLTAPLETVTVAAPLLTAVTFPVASTVATRALDVA